MREWNREKRAFWNRILIILCVILTIGLAAFLVWDRKSEQQKMEDLSRRAQEQSQELEVESAADESSREDPAAEQDGEGPEGTAKQEENSGQAGTGENSQEPASETSQEADGQSGSSRTEAGKIQISFRGDQFLSEEESAARGICALLEKKLQEAGYEADVADYSLTGAGTLSQMKLAGVADSRLQEYVTDHTEKAQGEELKVTETGIREFSQEELDRTDQEYIPVICMGYYGGWSNDPMELVRQQQDILDTYDSPRQWLILGLHPISGGVDPEGYDEMMEKAWGDSYLNLSEVMEHTAASYQGQEEIAQAVFDKLQELGYLGVE